ncbi:MAG TPA: 3-dehydroquinate synthase [Vicinamibacterales bacterium]|nr:3-dehydroquinate synthase [Vicinamibacterales bacterium]
MDVIHQEFLVPVRYPVYFTTGVFAASNQLLRDIVTGGISTGIRATVAEDTLPVKAVVVVDRGVDEAHPALLASIAAYCEKNGDALTLATPVLVVPGGEQIKDDRRHLERIIDAINASSLCRHSYVIAVGGGAVLDAAGFAAATAHRGVRLIRVPTTVLSQDDSAVGVKNGINAFGKKNYLGTFTPPFAVINDGAFLSTLSDRDWRGGTTEAVKAALIRDMQFFEFLEQHASALVDRDLQVMTKVIRHSAMLHLRHIATGGDPFEQGSSRPLDFGHWAAHKLEQVTNHRLGHGEAVGVGIALDTTYSHLAGFLPETSWRRIVQLLAALGVPLYDAALENRLDTPDHSDCILLGLDEFREHLGGRLTIMLLKEIGQPFDVHEVRADLVRQSIATIKTLEAERMRSAAKKAS